MKSRWFGILAVFAFVGCLIGCGSSATDSESDGYGFAALQIQWPDESGLRGDASGDATEASLSASDRQMAKAYVFDGCEAREVVTILVEVRDDHEHHLVSDSFECAQRIGEIKNIAVGLDRQFIVSALDGDGNLRYYGDKTGVSIETGFNEVGVIALLSVGDVIIPPEVTITAPEDGSTHTQGTGIPFEGGAVDAEGSALTGDALVWTSDVDGVFGAGTTLTFSDFSVGTHVITLAATDGGGETGVSSISITIEEGVIPPPEVNIIRPFEGGLHPNNGNIFFEGEAFDSENGALTGDALVWTSDRDGGIGFGASFVTSLSVGVHEIRLTATDSKGATGEALVTIRVIAPKLPDTGQTLKTTETSGEDSDYTINPPSYTKLDEAGRPLPDNSISWAMVRDNVTGLVWEVKKTDGSIHDNSSRYTWNQAEAVFIETLNQNRFGGYDDWRLPTVMELYTIVYADNYNPAVNTLYFPNIPSGFNSWYLSATPLADSPTLPWVVDFYLGVAPYSNYGESTEHYVRAVRGTVFQTGPFRDNGDDTVTDRKTGLIWQLWEPYEGVSWEDALIYCRDLELAGYADWRLPNRHELHSLVNYNAIPAFPPVFEDNLDSHYWTSTSSPENKGDAYTVLFFYGYGDYWGKNNYDDMQVRCVRGGN